MGVLAADPKLKAEAARTNFREAEAGRTTNDGKITPAQAEFFRAANASAVEDVVGRLRRRPRSCCRKEFQRRRGRRCRQWRSGWRMNRRTRL